MLENIFGTIGSSWVFWCPWRLQRSWCPWCLDSLAGRDASYVIDVCDIFDDSDVRDVSVNVISVSLCCPWWWLWWSLRLCCPHFRWFLWCPWEMSLTSFMSVLSVLSVTIENYHLLNNSRTCPWWPGWLQSLFVMSWMTVRFFHEVPDDCIVSLWCPWMNCMVCPWCPGWLNGFSVKSWMTA